MSEAEAKTKTQAEQDHLQPLRDSDFPFETWIKILGSTHNTHDLGRLAIEKLDQSARSFRELKQLLNTVYRHVSDDAVIGKRLAVLRRLTSCACEVVHWLFIYDSTISKSEGDQALHRLAQKNIFEADQSFDEWKKLLDTNRCNDDGFKLSVLNKLAEMAQNLAEWKLVYLRAPDDSDLKPKALEAIAGLSEHFGVWNNLHSSDNNNVGLRAVALRKMAETASSYDEWLHLLNHVPSESDEARKALAAMTRLTMKVPDMDANEDQPKPAPAESDTPSEP